MAYRNQMREKHSGNNNQTKESQNIIEKPAETMKQENIIVENKQSKKENLFQFQSRRENEQRVNDAQNQLQAYQEEMKKKMQKQHQFPHLFCPCYQGISLEVYLIFFGFFHMN